MHRRSFELLLFHSLCVQGGRLCQRERSSLNAFGVVSFRLMLKGRSREAEGLFRKETEKSASRVLHLRIPMLVL